MADIFDFEKKPHVSNNSGNDEWYTPKKYIDAVTDVLLWIDLDPASCEIANKTVNAKKFYTACDDGLKKSWAVEKIFLNPPYSQPLIKLFANKVAAKEFKEGIVLCNNATETAWFQKMANVADCICFTSNRISFIDRKGLASKTPLQGQAFLYFGENPDKFFTIFNKIGLCVFVRTKNKEREMQMDLLYG